MIGAAAEKSTLTASDKKYYAIDGDITVDITGGVFNGGAPIGIIIAVVCVVAAIVVVIVVVSKKI